MLTKKQILDAISNGRESGSMDGRDYNRLAAFFTVEEMKVLGAKPTNTETFVPIEFTLENILAQLKSDLDFAFEKALNKRGLSSSAMRAVIKMWMWILEDDLQNDPSDNYAMYGLPLLKAVAIKYNLPNEIGEDTGSEQKYNEDDY